MTGKSGADKSGLFRAREGQEANRVTNIELFFDLVFVFAVTQLSHRLLTHLDLTGAVETLILFSLCGGCGFTRLGSLTG